MTIGHLWHYPTPIKRVVCQDFGPVQELSYNKPALRADDTSNVGREEVQTLLRCWMKTNGLNLERAKTRLNAVGDMLSAQYGWSPQKREWRWSRSSLHRIAKGVFPVVKLDESGQPIIKPNMIVLMGELADSAEELDTITGWVRDALLFRILALTPADVPIRPSYLENVLGHVMDTVHPNLFDWRRDVLLALLHMTARRDANDRFYVLSYHSSLKVKWKEWQAQKGLIRSHDRWSPGVVIQDLLLIDDLIIATPPSRPCGDDALGFFADNLLVANEIMAKVWRMAPNDRTIVSFLLHTVHDICRAHNLSTERFSSDGHRS